MCFYVRTERRQQMALARELMGFATRTSFAPLGSNRLPEESASASVATRRPAFPADDARAAQRRETQRGLEDV